MDTLLGMVLRKVFEVMNATLEASVSKEEIKATLFHMFLTMALGPDGYLAHFF